MKNNELKQKENKKYEGTRYISLAGFKHCTEIEEVTRAIRDVDFGDIKIMYGIHCSSKRMKYIDIEGEKSPAVKDIEKLISIMPEDKIPVIHYYSRDHKQAYLELSNLLEYVPNFSHIQLNMDWPLIREIEYLKTKFEHRNLKFVLQLPQLAISGLNDEQIARIVHAYDNVMDYVLIDRSGGLGKELDVEQTASLVNKIYEHSHIPVSVAGGLGANNITAKVYELRKECGNVFSIDAEKMMRTSDGTRIDTTKAAAFFKNTYEALK